LYNLQKKKKKKKTQQIYDVLCINREREVAYCKGSGEVNHFIWDKVVCEAETAISLA
jgi:hypothetical protein